jgi:hypothetical protein
MGNYGTTDGTYSQLAIQIVACNEIRTLKKIRTITEEVSTSRAQIEYEQKLTKLLISTNKPAIGWYVGRYVAPNLPPLLARRRLPTRPELSAAAYTKTGPAPLPHHPPFSCTQPPDHCPRRHIAEVADGGEER